MKQILSFYLILGLIGSNLIAASNSTNSSQSNQSNTLSIVGITVGSVFGAVIVIGLLAQLLMYLKKNGGFFNAIKSKLNSIANKLIDKKPEVQKLGSQQLAESLDSAIKIAEDPAIMQTLIEIAKDPKVKNEIDFQEAIYAKELPLKLTGFLETIREVITGSSGLQQAGVGRETGAITKTKSIEYILMKKIYESAKNVILKFQNSDELEKLINDVIGVEGEGIVIVPEKISEFIISDVKNIIIDVKLAFAIQDRAVEMNKTLSWTDIYDYIEKMDLTQAQRDRLYQNIEKAYAPKTDSTQAPKILREGLSEVGLNIDKIVDEIYPKSLGQAIQAVKKFLSKNEDEFVDKSTIDKFISQVELGKDTEEFQQILKLQNEIKNLDTQTLNSISTQKLIDQYERIGQIIIPQDIISVKNTSDINAKRAIENIIRIHNQLNPGDKISSTPDNVNAIYEKYRSGPQITLKEPQPGDTPPPPSHDNPITVDPRPGSGTIEPYEPEPGPRQGGGIVSDPIVYERPPEEV
ncbi:hypothetical protein A3F66_02635 [candidate division TM6 bacterium RIFCSPHIGHO2_12_FULL_32_22]|nr:MAG: hypothetical protein A3F66_02635 [candidate division TM6 bacterium RIFCSPHIGHO2_12_FULL_32_22]